MLLSSLLSNDNIQLDNLQKSHLKALSRIAFVPDLWRYVPTLIKSEIDIKNYIEKALKKRSAGIHAPYVIILKSSGEIIGSTRYYNIDNSNNTISIGYTWIAKQYQGKGLNTQIKKLMLDRAFSSGFIRVSVHIDAKNENSRRAAEKVGFTQEGILRSHMLLRDRQRRDTVIYSMLSNEWKKKDI